MFYYESKDKKTKDRAESYFTMIHTPGPEIHLIPAVVDSILTFEVVAVFPFIVIPG